eukprot:m.314448 g.314448  ORF g.314448 m.314448 type:complete len:81 (+) comp20267_c0_seq2:941-1183(+)
MAAQQVVMWFSGGGTSSVLHYDISENINCLLDGTKTILMINRSYADMLQTPEVECRQRTHTRQYAASTIPGMSSYELHWF